MINARAESVATKPSFREAFARRRCLVPVDGFYEWRREGSTKTPFWFHRPDRDVFALAGIWERRSAADGGGYGFAILTTDAGPDIADVHDRMPVLVPPAAFDAWLDRDARAGALEALLRAAPAGTLERHPVSSRVNRTTEDDVGLIEPA